jgi:hypothetical protein
MNKQLLLLIAIFISGSLYAQRPAPNSNINTNRLKTTVAAKDMLKVPFKLAEGTADYSIWKKGFFIAPNNLGGQDQMYNTVVNGCWSVGPEAYNLLPKEGMVSIHVKVQNRKKYMVTVHYSTGAYLKMKAHMQYSSGNDKDYSSSITQEDLDFTPAKKWPGTFSFVLEPEINKIGGGDIAAGFPVISIIQFSITDIATKESSKSASEYNMNFMGIEIKEIQ